MIDSAPTNPPSPRGPGKPRNQEHRQGREQKITQAFYLLQNSAAVWSEGAMLSRDPLGDSPPHSGGLDFGVRSDCSPCPSGPYRPSRPSCPPWGLGPVNPLKLEYGAHLLSKAASSQGVG